MPSVTKVWRFIHDSEGIIAISGFGSCTGFAFDGGDGNPPGCVRWSGAETCAPVDGLANRSITGESWQTWGVPAGANVTSIEVTQWDEAVPNRAVSCRLLIRVIDAGGNNVCGTGNDLVDHSLDTDSNTNWATYTDTTGLQNVLAADQPSTTDVRLQLEFKMPSNSFQPFDVRFDNIYLTMNYSGGARRRAWTAEY